MSSSTLQDWAMQPHEEPDYTNPAWWKKSTTTRPSVTYAHIAKAGKKVEKPICFLLDRLPREIRMKIFRYLFRRSAAVQPGYIHQDGFRDTKGGDHYYYMRYWSCKYYGYFWDEHRQTLNKSDGRYEHTYNTKMLPLPYYCRPDNEHIITIITEPTSRQMDLIASGARHLPFTFNLNDEEDWVQVGCQVVHRGTHGVQIINRVKVVLCKFFGFSILTACKQLSQECREIFYGENTFAFNAGGDFRIEKGGHAREELDHAPHLIPGMPRRNGQPQSRSQLDRAMQQLFVGKWRPKFVAANPLCNFLRRIGPDNARLLRFVKLEGRMKTVFNNVMHGGDENRKGPLGLKVILPLMTTVLKEACPDLRVLTLHMQDKDLPCNMYPDSGLFDDDMGDTDPRSHEQRIDDVVRDVVETFPRLQQLQLGGYFPDVQTEDDETFDESQEAEDYDDEWGMAARWIWEVKARAGNQANENPKRKQGHIVVTRSMDQFLADMRRKYGSVSSDDRK